MNCLNVSIADPEYSSRIRTIPSRIKRYRIPDPDQQAKNLVFVTQNIVTKPRKYDLGCFMFISDPDFSISDPESRG